MSFCEADLYYSTSLLSIVPRLAHTPYFAVAQRRVSPYPSWVKPQSTDLALVAVGLFCGLCRVILGCTHALSLLCQFFPFEALPPRPFLISQHLCLATVRLKPRE